VVQIHSPRPIKSREYAVKRPWKQGLLLVHATLSGRAEMCYQVGGGFVAVANPVARVLPKSYHLAVRW
jgi:hypothetical protein